MAFVVVICLGLGGWHLLMKYGRYVEVEGPAVVGQPIKVHGRFFGWEDRVYRGTSGYQFHVEPALTGREFHEFGQAKRLRGCWYSMERTLEPVDVPSEILVTLIPDNGHRLRCKVVVRPSQ
jgi:hypothetical protein